MCDGHSDVLVDLGQKTIGVDRCIAPLVKALNDAGYQTLASCCGHGRLPATVPLVDLQGKERWLILTKDRAEGETMMASFYAKPTGSATPTEDKCQEWHS
jgi:hypothetical protein